MKWARNGQDEMCNNSVSAVPKSSTAGGICSGRYASRTLDCRALTPGEVSREGVKPTNIEAVPRKAASTTLGMTNLGMTIRCVAKGGIGSSAAGAGQDRIG